MLPRALTSRAPSFRAFPPPSRAQIVTSDARAFPLAAVEVRMPPHAEPIPRARLSNPIETCSGLQHNLDGPGVQPGLDRASMGFQQRRHGLDAA